MAFDILQHIDKLQPDGGSISATGDQSFLCPACGSSNFKVNVTTGKWATFGCDCGNTEQGKRKIRDALSPAAKPGQPQIVPYDTPAKPRRPKAERHWHYFAPDSSEPAITVNRLDNPSRPDGDGWKGGRKIWQTQHLGKGTTPYSEVAAKVRLYREQEALQAIADGAAHILFLEGEPCVDAAWRLGLPAVCNLGGSGGFKPDRDGPAASGIPPERLVVCPDRDQPGIKHAARVAAAYPGCRWLYCYGTQAPEWNGSMPADGGLDLFDWIQDGATLAEIVAAIQGEPLPVAEPAGEAQGKTTNADLVTAAKARTQRLKEGLAEINALQDEDVKPLALIGLREELNLRRDEFSVLVRELIDSELNDQTVDARSLMDSNEKGHSAVVADFLSTGLTLLAGDGHEGKTSFAYNLADAIVSGGKFAGEFQATKGKVLIAQRDEGSSDTASSLRTIGVNCEQGDIEIWRGITRNRLGKLASKIKEMDAKYVILDSLMAIAGADISPKDAEFAVFIYELNRLAQELDVAMVLLHHTIKAGSSAPGKPKQINDKHYVVLKGDIYGGVYIFNSLMDCWAMWSYEEEGDSTPRFGLHVCKARSGFHTVGTIYEFSGNTEDNRFYLEGVRGHTTTLAEHRNTYERLLGYVKSRGGRGVTARIANRDLCIGNAKYASALLARAFKSRAASGIDRKQEPFTLNGRPSYIYFHASGPNARFWNEVVDEGDIEDAVEGGAATGEAPDSNPAGLSVRDLIRSRVRRRQKASEDTSSATDT